ncbi:MAG: hypothetical protein Alpg2KO_24330 [Alphaproteobacteria bacterium]
MSDENENKKPGSEDEAPDWMDASDDAGEDWDDDFGDDFGDDFTVEEDDPFDAGGDDAFDFDDDFEAAPAGGMGGEEDDGFGDDFTAEDVIDADVDDGYGEFDADDAFGDDFDDGDLGDDFGDDFGDEFAEPEPLEDPDADFGDEFGDDDPFADDDFGEDLYDEDIDEFDDGLGDDMGDLDEPVAAASTGGDAGGSKKGLMYGVIGALALVVVGGGGYFGYSTLMADKPAPPAQVAQNDPAPEQPVEQPAVEQPPADAPFLAPPEDTGLGDVSLGGDPAPIDGGMAMPLPADDPILGGNPQSADGGFGDFSMPDPVANQGGDSGELTQSDMASLFPNANLGGNDTPVQPTPEEQFGNLFGNQPSQPDPAPTAEPMQMPQTNPAMSDPAVAELRQELDRMRDQMQAVQSELAETRTELAQTEEELAMAAMAPAMPAPVEVEQPATNMPGTSSSAGRSSTDSSASMGSAAASAGMSWAGSTPEPRRKPRATRRSSAGSRTTAAVKPRQPAAQPEPNVLPGSTSSVVALSRPGGSGAARPRVRQNAPRLDVPEQGFYQLRGVSQGRAWLASDNTGQMIRVTVGDRLPGLGRVVSIRRGYAGWEVLTERGVIRE